MLAGVGAEEFRELELGAEVGLEDVALEQVADDLDGEPMEDVDVDGEPMDDLDGAPTRVVVLHELVHAYDHQHLSLARPGYDLDHTTERSTTFPMVVEGDAVRVEQLYVATLDPDDLFDDR